MTVLRRSDELRSLYYSLITSKAKTTPHKIKRLAFVSCWLLPMQTRRCETSSSSQARAKESPSPAPVFSPTKVIPSCWCPNTSLTCQSANRFNARQSLSDVDLTRKVWMEQCTCCAAIHATALHCAGAHSTCSEFIPNLMAQFTRRHLRRSRRLDGRRCALAATSVGGGFALVLARASHRMQAN